MPKVTVLNPRATKFFICCCCKHVKDTVVVIVTNIFIKLKNADFTHQHLPSTSFCPYYLPARTHPNTNTSAVFKH